MMNKILFAIAIAVAIFVVARTEIGVNQFEAKWEAEYAVELAARDAEITALQTQVASLTEAIEVEKVRADVANAAKEEVVKYNGELISQLSEVEQELNSTLDHKVKSAFNSVFDRS